MGKDKSALKDYGFGTSILCFLLSWFGLVLSFVYFIQHLIEVINFPVARELFFLPFHFIMVGVYAALVIGFGNRIIKLNKKRNEERLKNEKKRK